ncbi:hypothetical protein BDZ89DRAFT_949931 [Hymenopellis radicata]|nr:hypothetical protein BDZ89DRAFT_949931 [Hymenopellis radicata]
MLPPLGSKSAPTKFAGNYEDVKTFLRRYDRLCNAYNVRDAEKCERIIDYCSRSVVRLIESLQSYRDNDWAQLYEDLLEFYDADLKETRYNVRDIRKLAKKWYKKKIPNLRTWKKYQREFITISGWLVSKRKLTMDEEAVYFWHGINKTLRRRIESTYVARNPGVDLTQAFPIEAINKIAQVIFTRNRFDTNLIDSDDESDIERDEYISDSSSDSSDSTSSESEDDSDSDIEDTRKKHRKVSKKKKLTKRASDRGKHKKAADTSEVTNLISHMSRMSINDPSYAVMYYQAIKKDPICKDVIRRPQINPPPMAERSSFRSPFNRSIGMNNIATGANSVATMPNSIPLGIRQGPLICYGCAQEGHGLRNCPGLENWLRNGTIKRDPVTLRYLLANGEEIRRGPQETVVQAVNRMISPSAQINYIGLIPVDLDEDDTAYSICHLGATSTEPDSLLEWDQSTNGVYPVAKASTGISQARTQVVTGDSSPIAKRVGKRAIRLPQ